MASGLGLSQVKTIETPYLKIEGNCLEIENTCLQLSNISLFSTSNVSAAGLSSLLLDLAIVIVGIVLMTTLSVPIGLIVLAVGIYLGYTWVKNWMRAKSSKQLIIVTNSGITYSVVFEDQEFLNKVISAIIEIIRDPGHTKNIMIDIANGTFVNSTIGGEIHTGGGR